MKTEEFILAQKAAILAVGIEIGRGNLPKLRQEDIPCVDCGDRATIYDHRDYRRPVDVVPVCKSCNAKRGSASFAFESSLETPEKINLAFELFWESYPRKVAKPAAMKAFKAAEKLVDFPVLMGSLDWWKSSDEWNNPRFIPHPSTFLNQHRWNDAPIPRVKKESEIGTGPLERAPRICAKCGATGSWHLNAAKRGKVDHEFIEAPRA